MAVLLMYMKRYSCGEQLWDGEISCSMQVKKVFMRANKNLQIALLVDTNHFGKLNISWSKKHKSIQAQKLYMQNEKNVKLSSPLVLSLQVELDH